MFKQRTNKDVESRVRFKIQDLIDHYDEDWKHEIFFQRRNAIDSDGFQVKYVPKGSKLAEEAQLLAQAKGNEKGAGGGRSRKNSNLPAGSSNSQSATSSKNKEERKKDTRGDG